MLAVAYATGRASHARQVKGDDPDKKGDPGLPGWGLGVRLTTPLHKKYCYETSRGSQGSPTAVQPMMMMMMTITSKRQVDAVLFCISSAPDFVPHAPLLNKFTASGLLDFYAKCFRRRVTKRQFHFRITVIFSCRLEKFLVFRKDLFWKTAFSVQDN
jgi:hypothetical protein